MKNIPFYGLSALAVLLSCAKAPQEELPESVNLLDQTIASTTAPASLGVPEQGNTVYLAHHDTTAYFWHPVQRAWIVETVDYSTTGSLPIPASLLSVSNPLSLRSRTGLDSGELVRTKGFYTDNDGGSTDYVWSPNSFQNDDGASIIRPTAIRTVHPGRWKAIYFGGRVSVKQFGAKADFNGTSGTPIRPFVDKAVSVAAGKLTIWFPAGRYYTTSELKISGKKNVVVEGAPGAAIYKAKEGVFDGTECIFKFKDCENVRISGFSLYGHTPGLKYKVDAYGNYSCVMNPGDGGIYVYDSKDVDISKCSFYDFGDGAIRAATLVLVNGSVATRRVKVRNNYFRNIYQLSTTYTSGSACADYTLENNVFDTVKGSIKFASRTTGANNIVIRNNTVRNAFNIAFELNNVSDVQLLNNTAEAPAKTPMHPVGVSIYPNIVSSGSVVHGNMNNFTIRGGSFRNFRKGVRVKNEKVNSRMYTMYNFRVANVDFYNMTGTTSSDAAVHFLSNMSQGPANIRYVTVDSIRVHGSARHGVLADYYPETSISNHQFSVTNSSFDNVAYNAVWIKGPSASRFKGVRVEKNTVRASGTAGRMLVGQYTYGLLIRNNKATTQGGVLELMECAAPKLEYNVVTSVAGFGFYFYPVTGAATLTGNSITVQNGSYRTLRYYTNSLGSTATLSANRFTGGTGTEYSKLVKVIYK